MTNAAKNLDEADGNCFVVAAEIVSMFDKNPRWMGEPEAQAATEALNKLGVEGSALRLVHGWVIRKFDGLKHVHAWVEYECPNMGIPMVIDYANGRENNLPSAIYYSAGVDEIIGRFDSTETRRQMVEHAHYGPWDGSV